MFAPHPGAEFHFDYCFCRWYNLKKPIHQKRWENVASSSLLKKDVKCVKVGYSHIDLLGRSDSHPMMGNWFLLPDMQHWFGSSKVTTRKCGTWEGFCQENPNISVEHKPGIPFPQMIQEFLYKQFSLRVLGMLHMGILAKSSIFVGGPRFRI